MRLLPLDDARRGSALLIVLGFLAFMVVSAVSFSIYMRTERIASSGFRHTVTGRQLLKAGLARAMQEIDYRVGDDPFPGINLCGRGDRWPMRVLTPGGDLDPDTTIPVLPLEGLAYLPPAIVNEVRAQSRATTNAMWKTFDYEAGRYAFVAVNVSDFFDVNRLRFANGRNSGPNGHVSLAYLFQDNVLDPRNPSSEIQSAGQLSALDDFLDNRGGGAGSQYPFVSMADFNVALYTRNLQALRSPFFDYVKPNNTPLAFYARNAEAEITDDVSPMLFVTDYWSQPTNRDDLVDLQVREDQPFLAADFNRQSGGFLQFSKKEYAGGGRALQEVLKEDLNAITTANLFDYLDEDNVPISLAIPSVERVPMIGVVNASALGDAIKLELEKKDVEPGDSNPFFVTTYSLKPSGTLMLPVKCLFPFKRGGRIPFNFKVQACVKLFFAPAECGMRAATAMSPTVLEWTTARNAVTDTGFTLFSRQANVPRPKGSISGDDTVQSVVETIVQLPPLSTIASELGSKFLLQTKVKAKKDPDSGMWIKDPDAKPTITTQLQPLAAQANAASGTAFFGAPIPNVADAPTDPNRAGKAFTARLAVWVRVVEDDYTVDLAPASLEDDKLNRVATILPEAARSMFGMGIGHPVLNVKGAELTFQDGDWSVDFPTTAPFSGQPGCFVALDPRYNFCPEDFVLKDDKGYSAAQYAGEIDQLLGQDGRDSDAMMFCSNQEYLQSVGELAFLPRVCDLGSGYLAGAYFDNENKPAGDWPGTDFASMPKSHKNFFWRTYRLFKQGDLESDYLFDYNIVNGAGDYKVNPYSDIDKIRLAVTANTPYDYWASSTNTQYSAVAALSFPQNLNYCFNAMSGNTEAKLAWHDLTNITANVFNKLRSLASKDNPQQWREDLAQLDWYGNGSPDEICDHTLSGASDSLDSVDRKMLFSWWHDSMANDQQLFLVFVRVEPTPFGIAAAGSSSKSVLPSQLGTRAVALVWRDPGRPQNAQSVRIPDVWSRWDEINDVDYVPHKMQILFYHQFEQ